MLAVQGQKTHHVADVAAMSLPVCTSFFFLSCLNLVALLLQLSRMQIMTDLFNLACKLWHRMEITKADNCIATECAYFPKATLAYCTSCKVIPTPHKPLFSQMSD
jgi:hypothetical protein